MNHLCSTLSLLTRLHEPEQFVDSSCDLGEDVSRIGVLQFGRLLAGIACMLAKGGERRRKRIAMALSIGSRKPILVKRSPPGDRLRGSLSHATELHNVLGNQVRILRYSLFDLVEQFAQGHEMRPLDIPVGLSALELQIDGVG